MGHLCIRPLALFITFFLFPHTVPHPPLRQPAHHLGAEHLSPKPFLLQQLQHLQRRSRIRQELGILWPREVEQIVEVGDEGRLLEEMDRGEMVEVERIGEGLDEG